MLYEQKIFNIDESVKNLDVLNKKEVSKTHKRFKEDYKQKRFPFLSIVNNKKKLVIIKKTARFLTNFKNIIFLGTGGSSLGGKTLHALSKFKNKKNLFFLDNVDPETNQSIVDLIEPSNTAIVVISKSGETIETLCQYFFFSNFLKKKNIDLRNKVVVITEKKPSTLKLIQEEENYTFIEHDYRIGGRYSIFSVVGLLPAYLSGLNIENICKGGRVTLKTFLDGKNVLKVPQINAAIQNVKLIKNNFNQFIMMPYVDKLYNFSFWYRQLWGESIGKKGLGSTPINAIGTVDQHSQLQLYLDGPKNKYITIIGFSKPQNSKKIDARISKATKVENLHNKTMGQLFYAEKEATFETLRRKKIPIRMIQIEKLDESMIGSLLMSFFIETIYTCYILGIDPFDQPAVEEGKKLAIHYLNNENKVIK